MHKMVTNDGVKGGHGETEVGTRWGHSSLNGHVFQVNGEATEPGCVVATLKESIWTSSSSSVLSVWFFKPTFSWQAVMIH